MHPRQSLIIALLGCLLAAVPSAAQTLEPLLPEPSGREKSRFISLVVPAETGGSTDQAALRVDLLSLHHVDPPYPVGPGTPFTLFEGLHVWAGPPRFYVESAATPIRFVASHTQCSPHYRNWSEFKACTGPGTTGPICNLDTDCTSGQTCSVVVPSGVPILHITGSAIVPSSIYEVVKVHETCAGQEDSCSVVSESLELRTCRWADVELPYNPPSTTAQPDIGDVGALINKFRSAPGAPIKACALLIGTDVFGQVSMVPDTGWANTASCVDAYRGHGYPYKMGKCNTGSTACNTDSECTPSNRPCNLYCP